MRGRQWEITCAEVAKLRIMRMREDHGQVIALPVAAVAGAAPNEPAPELKTPVRGPVVVQSAEARETEAEKSGGGGSRTRVRRCIRANVYACRHAI